MWVACLVCKNNVVVITDYYVDGHTLMSSSSACLHCKLWEHHYDTGSYHEIIGFSEWYWWYDEPGGKLMTRLTESALARAEAKKMLKFSEVGAFCEQMRESPEDTTLPLIFADWLAEHGFTIAESEIRRTVRTKQSMEVMP